jgi:hypothetical protein
VFKSTALTVLRTFRQQLHASLGLRQDSLFELLDSALSSPDRRTLVRLSLNPAFRRRWPSTCDALADGRLDPSALRRLFVQTLPPAPDRPLWVIIFGPIGAAEELPRTVLMTAAWVINLAVAEYVIRRRPAHHRIAPLLVCVGPEQRMRWLREA